MLAEHGNDLATWRKRADAPSWKRSVSIVMKNPSYLVLLLSCFLYLPAFAEPTLLVLSGEEHAGPAKARSKGVVFDRVRFDESGEIADAKS